MIAENYDAAISIGDTMKKSERSLQAKLSFRLLILMLVTTLILAAFLLYGFRALGIKTSEGKAFLAAEMVRTALASAKERDLIEERDAFLDPILHMNNLESIRIVRGPPGKSVV